MRAALALIATSSAPEAAPARASVTISTGREVARPGSVAATANAAHVSATARTPKRSTSGPATKSIAGSEPTVTNSIATPSAPFETPVASCTLGSTAAHAPQKSPSARKPASVGLRLGVERSVRHLRRLTPSRISRPRRGRAPRAPTTDPTSAARVELGGDPPALGPGRLDLLHRVAALVDPLVEHVCVLPLPRAVGRHPDVELEILRVVALGGAAERLLQVHVPARELALGAFPEDPDRVRLAGALQHQHAVALPAGASVPGMAAVRRRPVALRELERRARGDIRREQLRLVADDDHRHLRPAAPVVQHLAAHDRVALRPHASPPAARAARPGGRRAPVLPARRPRRRRDHALALGADLAPHPPRPDPELDRLRELVLVLPRQVPSGSTVTSSAWSVVSRNDPFTTTGACRFTYQPICSKSASSRSRRCASAPGCSKRSTCVCSHTVS